MEVLHRFMDKLQAGRAVVMEMQKHSFTTGLAKVKKLGEISELACLFTAFTQVIEGDRSYSLSHVDVDGFTDLLLHLINKSGRTGSFVSASVCLSLFDVLKYRLPNMRP